MRLLRCHSSSSSSSSSFFPYFTYTLNSSLYIPLTSFCNSRTLPESRGPSFLLPPAVVAALCRVRDAETRVEKWRAWCNWLDLQDSPVKLPTALERVYELDKTDTNVPHPRPTVEELCQEALQTLEEMPSIKRFVIAGEGEPTLRFHDLTRLTTSLRQHSSLPIRLTTNGLVAEPVVIAEQLVAAKVNAVSVALMTHDAEQYNHLMQPLLRTDRTNKEQSRCPHDRVCQFIRAAVQSGLHVEVTAVAHPEVNQSETNDLATELGVASPVRWRTYFL